MKMHFTKALGVCCTLALFFLTTGNANAQCLTDEYGQWPTAAYTPPACDGSLNVISSAAWTGEYSVVNVVSGEEYIFSSSVPSHYITISTDAGATAAAFGTGSVSWTSTITGEVRFYTHLSDACDFAQTGHARQVLCGEPDCPALGANIGDSCDDGDPNTFGDTITENCDCVGQTGGPGDACNNPIVITSLPFTASDNTANYANSVSTMPTLTTFPGISNGTGSASYISGPEAVYEYTASGAGLLEITLNNTTGWVGLIAFKGCPFNERLAYSTSTTGDSRNISQLPLSAGETIYIVVSTWESQTASTTYDIVIEEFAFDCPGLEANIGDACDDENAGTFDDVITESCTCEGTPFDCPALEANFGDACDDGNPDTNGSTIDANCDCTGGIGLADNQTCETAEPISCGDSVTGSTIGASSDDVVTCGTTNGTGGGVWYTFVPDVSGIATFDLCGSDFDTKIRVYTGSCGAFECVGGNDDNFTICGAGNASYLEADVTQGETYYVLVHGFSANEGIFTMNITCDEFDCPVLEGNIGDACDDGDLFTVNTTLDANCDCTGGTAVPAGGACFNPIFVSSLPFTDTDSTVSFLDIYSNLDMPAGVTFPEISTGFQSAFYLNGDDAVYSYIPSSNGAIDITLSDHGTWAGLWVFKGCPEFDETVAYHVGSDATGRSIEGMPVQGGELYYVVVSSNPAPQSINYTLTIQEAEFDCPTLEANIGASCDDGDPTTFDDIVDENCNCTGIPFDCPTELANIGDLCDANGEVGLLDSTCVCVEVIFEGCNNGGSWLSIDAACDSTETASGQVAGSFVQEYSTLLNVGNGQEFTFSVTDHTGDIQVFYVTITDATGGILASGIAPFDWTSTVGGDLRYYTHGSPTCFGDITGGASSHTRVASWDCSTIIFDCPAIEANFGDSCDDGDSGTFNDVINENCDCVGTPYDCPAEQANIGDSCDDVPFGVITENCDCVAAVFEGCTVEDFGLFGEFETVCNDSVNGGSFEQTGAWVQEYSEIVVGTDVEYTFYTTGLPATIPTAFITLTDTDNNIFDFGTDTLVWTAPAALDGDTIRFWVHGAPDCVSGITGSASSHTKNIDYVCAPAGCTADGGTLTAVSSRSVCVGTGSPQGIDVQLSGASGENSRWGLIAPNGNILDTRVNNSQFNLDGYAPGNYAIRHLSYDDDVSLFGITNISQLSNLEGCWDASNAITVFLRNEPNGGTLTAQSPTTVCANNGSTTGIAVSLSGATGENSRFGLRNLSAPGNPIVAQQAGTTFNLNGFAPGTYEVRHLAYQEGVEVSSSIQFQSELSGCFDVSNGITVSIVDCASAQLTSSPNPTAGQSFVTFTNPREETATVEVYDMSGRLVSTIFRQVTNPDQEYRLEFDGAGLPNGVYLYRMTTPSEVIVDKFMIAK